MEVCFLMIALLYSHVKAFFGGLIEKQTSSSFSKTTA